MVTNKGQGQSKVKLHVRWAERTNSFLLFCRGLTFKMPRFPLFLGNFNLILTVLLVVY